MTALLGSANASTGRPSQAWIPKVLAIVRPMMRPMATDVHTGLGLTAGSLAPWPFDLSDGELYLRYGETKTYRSNIWPSPLSAAARNANPPPEEKPASTITLYVYTGRDASFSIYEDEDTNYNYEKGAYANILISYNESAKTLTIGKRKGTFNGMLKEREFKIVWVTKDKPVELDFGKHADAIVRYKGNEKTVHQL